LHDTDWVRGLESALKIAEPIAKKKLGTGKQGYIAILDESPVLYIYQYRFYESNLGIFLLTAALLNAYVIK